MCLTLPHSSGCSGELTSKRRERVAAESRCQALRSELRRAVGQLSVPLEQHVLSLLNQSGKEQDTFTAALKQLEDVSAPTSTFSMHTIYTIYTIHIIYMVYANIGIMQRASEAAHKAPYMRALRLSRLVAKSV